MSHIDDYKKNLKFNDYKWRKATPFTTATEHFIVIKKFNFNPDNGSANFRIAMEVDDEFILIPGEFSGCYCILPRGEEAWFEDGLLPSITGGGFVAHVVDDIEGEH